jgi:hypothetical protein
VLLVATSVDELRVPTCRAVARTGLWVVEKESPHGAPTVGRLVPWDIGQTASFLAAERIAAQARPRFTPSGAPFRPPGNGDLG